MMNNIYGYYVDKPLSQDQLTLKFSPCSIPIKDRWRNNGLSADFMADYLATFIPKDDYDPSTIQRQQEVKSAASYIANELLENSMKYCDYGAKFSISIQLQLDADQIRFFVTNSIPKASIEPFKAFIEQMINSDPSELYFQQLEKNAQNKNSTASGLGLLSMVNDYSAMLGWKFEKVCEKPEIIAITTMVQLTF
ncbi:MAG: ATP-binding protein [Nostocales cyanobacterium 94392]|nr:ATP-binding protein [Nostocales cyanobacterium 94392]